MLEEKEVGKAMLCYKWDHCFCIWILQVGVTLISCEKTKNTGKNMNIQWAASNKNNKYYFDKNPHYQIFFPTTVIIEYLDLSGLKVKNNVNFMKNMLTNLYENLTSYKCHIQKDSKSWP